ncbi:ATP synthase F1 subunit epsilon [uncultured Allofournierella sp.]|uniref:ATP synthase F1 subunit epsilon n=1 Tax=uncultured Allofournierella sp. TaxID=1940258 RepID=UPI0037508D25
MSTFPLQIVTPEGAVYDGQAQRVLCRTIAGDVCILPRHCDYITALGMGEARVTTADGTVRRAACIGGLLTVRQGQVRLVATTFEWAEDIDRERAERSSQRAHQVLEDAQASAHDIELAQARLKRALVRSSVANRL